MKIRNVVLACLFAVLLVGLFIYFGNNFSGAGGVTIEAPETVVSGNALEIMMYTSLWGADANNIDNVYLGSILYYRHNEDNEFSHVTGSVIDLPENYKSAESGKNRWKAYKFVVPTERKGEIEYFIELENPSNPNSVNGEIRIDGTNTVKVI